MVSLQEIKCPYCHKLSYFESSMDSGYCTHCGKIIYGDGKSTVQFSEDVIQTQPAHRSYDVTFHYSKFNYEYGRTAIVNISGPVSRQIAVNVNEPLNVNLPEGQYQIIASVHVDAGVNSTDVVGSIAFHLKDDRHVYMEASGIFIRRLNIK